MTIDLPTFRAQYPEFSKASDALVTARLADAVLRTPSDIWGDKTETGTFLLTAHLLALGPNGRDLRKGEKPGDSPYWRERNRMAITVSSGFRVAGGV